MLEDRLLIWKFNRGRKDVLEQIYAKYKDDLMTLSANKQMSNEKLQELVESLIEIKAN